MYKQIKVSISVPRGGYCNLDALSICRFMVNGSGGSSYCIVFSEHLIKDRDNKKKKCAECILQGGSK